MANQWQVMKTTMDFVSVAESDSWKLHFIKIEWHRLVDWLIVWWLIDWWSRPFCHLRTQIPSKPLNLKASFQCKTDKSNYPPHIFLLKLWMLSEIFIIGLNLFMISFMGVCSSLSLSLALRLLKSLVTTSFVSSSVYMKIAVFVYRAQNWHFRFRACSICPGCPRSASQSECLREKVSFLPPLPGSPYLQCGRPFHPVHQEDGVKLLMMMKLDWSFNHWEHIVWQ